MVQVQEVTVIHRNDLETEGVLILCASGRRTLQTLVTSTKGLVTLVVCLSLNFSVSADQYDVSEIYQNRYTKAPSGVYIHDNLVFVIANIAITNKAIRLLHYEGKALIKTHKLLKSHIIQGLDVLPGVTGLSRETLKAEQTNLVNAKNFANFRLSGIPSRVLVNRRIRGTYRRVAVFQADDITSKRTQIIKSLEGH